MHCNSLPLILVKRFGSAHPGAVSAFCACRAESHLAVKSSSVRWNISSWISPVRPSLTSSSRERTCSTTIRNCTQSSSRNKRSTSNSTGPNACSACMLMVYTQTRIGESGGGHAYSRGQVSFTAVPHSLHLSESSCIKTSHLI